MARWCLSITIIIPASLLITYCVALETGLLIHESFQPTSPVFNETSLSNFVQLAFFNDLIIDKSLFLKSFLESKNRVFMVTCPSSWGKSVNNDMIRTFFQRKYEFKDNKSIAINLTSSYRLFVHGEAVFGEESKMLKTPPLISRHQDFIDKYLGQIPVIHLDFGYAFGYFNYSSLVAGIRYCISLAFEEHILATKPLLYLMYSNTSTASEKARATKDLQTFDNFIGINITNTEEITNSVVFLSKILHNFYKRKVIVLMDEFMLPWQHLFLHDTFPERDRKLFFKFYSDFMTKTLKANTHLMKALIVSEIPPTEELMTKVFSYFVECSTLTGTFMEYYGFNQQEIKNLYDQFDLPENSREEVDRWYKGYKVNGRDLKIYNSWSIMNYMVNMTVDRYWMKIAEIEDYLANCLTVSLFREKFRHLIDGEGILIVYRRYFNFTELERQVKLFAGTRDAINYGKEIGDSSFVFLFNIGYLTLHEDCNLKSKLIRYNLTFPNEEIGSIIASTFNSYC